ncbi:MAG: DUF4870 domain-containing protein [Terriglobales bacterium]
MTFPEQGTAASEPVPTADERTMATLAHVLQLVGWFIAPLIIFFLRRNSRFVSFHALQAVFLQLVYMLVWICFMVVWFAFIFGTVFSGGKSEPPPLFLILVPLMWLFAMGIWLLLLVTAIVYGMKAGKGEWAAYPVIGGWARRVLEDGHPAAPPAAY